MLKPVVKYDELKKKFSSKFTELLLSNNNFKHFIYELLIKGAKFYIVGGFLRDLILEKPSRDIDIIIDLQHIEIINLINEYKLTHTVNRMNGIKLSLNNIQIDLWSINHNWAFENKLVSRNDNDILESIASGCFYNYDALVINGQSLNINVHYFNNMIETNTLDILRKNSNYKSKNPTIEANILRAFYLRYKYQLKLSTTCNAYIVYRIGYLDAHYGSAIERLFEFRHKYAKYFDILDYQKIDESIDYCKINSDGQIWLDFDDNPVS